MKPLQYNFHYFFLEVICFNNILITSLSRVLRIPASVVEFTQALDRLHQEGTHCACVCKIGSFSKLRVKPVVITD